MTTPDDSTSIDPTTVNDAPRRGLRVGRSLRRGYPLLAVAAVLVVASGTGGAVAASLITSQQIKDFTIQSRDLSNGAVNSRAIKNGSVKAGDLTKAARAALVGQPGAAGSRWLTGTGAPGALSASDGDWYLDSTTRSLYTRVGGAWGFVVNIAGAKGDQGADGIGVKGDPGEAGQSTTWRSGTGVPSNNLGVDGDWYLDSTTSKSYQKSGGEWDFRVSFQGIQGNEGDDGLDGATWFTGSGVPTSTLGANTDLYLDTVTSDVYRKASGSWSLLTNIKGQQGDPGDTGDDGTDGATWLTGAAAPTDTAGKNTDLYLNTVTGDVYRKAAGAWGAPVANLTGPDGTDGDDGTDGAGTSWSTGTGAPAGTLGSNGDFYLDTASGAVYTKAADTWTQQYAGAASSSMIFRGIPTAFVRQNGSEVPQTDVGTSNPTAFWLKVNESVDTSDAWDGSTFTASSAGLYQVQVQTFSATVPPHLEVDVNDGSVSMGTTPMNLPCGTTPGGGASNAVSPFDACRRSVLNVTISLTAGQTFRIGARSNSSVVGADLNGGTGAMSVIKLS